MPGGLFGGGGGGGSGQGGTVFELPGQSEVTGALGDIMRPLGDLSANGGAGTPGAWAYPQAQQLYPSAFNTAEQFLTGSMTPGGGETPQGMFGQRALTGATGAADYATNSLFPMGANNSSMLSGAASMGIPAAGQVLSNAFDPSYQNIINQFDQNPFYGASSRGAQYGSQMGQQGAQNLYSMGNELMQSGFDPQSALFNRGQQQTLDQANVANSMAGLGGTPYGASNTTNALSNFGINWQNQQLGRQQQAASAASPLFQAAPGLSASSAALPGGVFSNYMNELLGAMGARDTAGMRGAGGFSSLLGSTQAGLTGAQNIGNSAAQGLGQFTGMPYSTGATIGQNSLNATNALQSQLMGATNIGNDQFKLPLDVASKLMQYLGLGQSASGISGQLQQQSFNQTAQGIGGLLGGANMLLGGGSGLGGLGSLFGGGSSAAAAAPWLGSAIGGGASMAGGAASAGGIGSLLAMIPALFSDRRLKTDIERIGTLANGLPVYSYRYKGDPVHRVGLMADEVERVHPEAVVEGALGFKMVNYQRAVA